VWPGFIWLRISSRVSLLWTRLWNFGLHKRRGISWLPERLSRGGVAQSVQQQATGWTIGWLGFHSRRGMGIFLFDTASRPALGPTQPPIQWVPVVLTLVVKRQRREANQSPPSTAGVKECVELYLQCLIVFMTWCLVKCKDNFILVRGVRASVELLCN
jgi:hypothetical protein